MHIVMSKRLMYSMSIVSMVVPPDKYCYGTSYSYCGGDYDPDYAGEYRLPSGGLVVLFFYG